MRLRIDAEQDCLVVWPLENQDKAELYRLVSNLRSWGFSPDYHGPRPPTEDELAGVTGMGGGSIARMAREKGVVWYEWPLVIQRSKDDAAGPGFDDLREELAKRGNEISSMELSEILKDVRWRNIPPGRSGRDYM
jgi:hypothetical protein